MSRKNDKGKDSSNHIKECGNIKSRVKLFGCKTTTITDIIQVMVLFGTTKGVLFNVKKVHISRYIILFDNYDINCRCCLYD